MKRREIIKKGLLAAGGAALVLSGCKNDEVSNADFEQKTVENYEDIDIIPKQTATYEFNVPMPMDLSVIDNIEKLNSKYKKSRVATFYNNTPLPLGSNFNKWGQIVRGENPLIRTYEDYAKCVRYAKQKGFRVSYLLNSPKSFSEIDFERFKKEFYFLLDYLYDLHIDDIKVGNTQVADLIKEYGKPFRFSWSTASELHTVSQYKLLDINHPNIDLIDVSNDENHNFGFLRAMRKMFPNKKLEIMVNEACFKGCPARISHASELTFCKYDCLNVMKQMGEMHYFFKLGFVYPWNLPYYSAIGVNNFKFLPEGNNNLRANFRNLSYLKSYFDLVEYGIENVPAIKFFKNTYTSGWMNTLSKKIMLTELMPYFPDIRHFIKNGYMCAVKCDVDCHYCGTCAKKMMAYINEANKRWS